jgi:hypothetical protein
VRIEPVVDGSRQRRLDELDNDRAAGRGFYPGDRLRERREVRPVYARQRLAGLSRPEEPGGFPTAAIESLGPGSPQFASANARCVRLLPNDGQPTPAQLQQTIENGLRLVRCMRAHGEPSFPDPGLSGGEITINFNNLDPNSPQYEKAEQTCMQVKNP